MPPKFDLDALPSLDEIPAGSISNLKKPQLFSLAKELSLDPHSKATNPELKKQISEALGSQKFLNDTRFLKFTVHRAGTTGGAALKNSADKDKQDVDAAVVKQDVPSGAHKKLLEQNATTDPVPQFKILNNTAKKSSEMGDSDESSLSSIDETEEKIVKPEKPAKMDKPAKPSSKINTHQPLNPSRILVQQDEAEARLPIVVQFQGKNDHSVWITPSQREAIPLFKEADGSITTSLKKLVPAALMQLSPAKGDRYSKLSVLTDTGALSLGEMHHFMVGNFPEILDMVQADTCKLEQQADRLICRFLYRPGKPPSADMEESSDKIKPLDLAKARPKTAGKKKKRIVLAGENTDDEGDWPDNEKDHNFLTFLNIVVGGPRNGFTDTLGTIGEQLGRWNTRARCIQYCDDNCKTGRKGKPYRIPEEYKEHANPSYHGYANRPFTKKDITDALGISNGTVTADKNAFDCPDIECDPLAQRWVKGDETLDPKVSASFNKIKRKAWLAHLEKAKADKAAADKGASRAKQREQRVSSKEQERGKRRHESDGSTEVDSEDERQAKRELRRIKKKRKAQEVGNGNEAGPSRHKERSKAPTSEDLDNDSDPAK
ncbi:hypothetical protein C8R45DRAFT_1105209 [Mycena sanguinolenta]|nr:hypothetical protein C8R45DRAFT_1105209 [Mycena sanguinolenta]